MSRIPRAFGGRKVLSPETAALDEWTTPLALIASVAEHFGGFDLDLAGDEGAHAAPEWWGPGGAHLDALKAPLDAWKAPWMRGWCNPPFSRADAFTALCAAAVNARPGRLIVQVAKLVPETQWWSTIWRRAAEVWVPSARIKFIPPGATKGTGSPSHATALIVWRQGQNGPPAWRRCTLGKDQGVVRWSL